MKIGILTFHSAINYGAVLQTWASVRFLQSLGHEVSVLDYGKADSTFRWDKERLEKEGIKYVLKWPILVFRRFMIKQKFKNFQKRELPVLPYSKANEMDVLLVGSDQIWNKRFTGGADPVYFGDSNPGVRKVAWAASSGKASLSREDLDRIQRNFSAISVREHSLATMIPGSVLLPDPTMMLSVKQWEHLVHPVKGSYMLVYPMLYQEEVLEKARTMAGDLGLEMRVLSPAVKLRSDWIRTAAPDDFVSLFYYASYVVTSSFHGAVFSLLFGRPHTFIYHDDPRYDTLLKTDISEAAVVASAFAADHIC